MAKVGRPPEVDLIHEWEEGVNEIVAVASKLNDKPVPLFGGAYISPTIGDVLHDSQTLQTLLRQAREREAERG